MPEIYFLRHGQSQSNVENRFANGNDGYPLTDQGRRQAEKAAEFLRSKKIRKVYTSPIHRAVQTAEIVCSKWGLTPSVISVIDKIREFSVGIFEGKRIAGKARELYVDLKKAWAMGDMDTRIPEGESHREIIDRLWKGIEYALVGNGQEPVLMVSHGGLLSMALPYMCDNLDLTTFYEQEGVFIRNCSVTSVQTRTENSRISLSLMEWADDSYIDVSERSY
ncbi:histidine phosphatase family protein [Mesotoga prima]|uniref:histidine phosphatase family protein n=1 Tax=Mesotoga prima TaxID=1184387 RepID=UPI002BF95123|nr:histidine phosphatase family protein [Mesotoga prima]HQC13766.1 histidine phosphatase family protein [Mesotoga prima]